MNRLGKILTLGLAKTRLKSTRIIAAFLRAGATERRRFRRKPDDGLPNKPLRIVVVFTCIAACVFPFASIPVERFSFWLDLVEAWCVFTIHTAVVSLVLMGIVLTGRGYILSMIALFIGVAAVLHTASSTVDRHIMGPGFNMFSLADLLYFVLIPGGIAWAIWGWARYIWVRRHGGRPQAIKRRTKRFILLAVLAGAVGAVFCFPGTLLKVAVTGNCVRMAKLTIAIGADVNVKGRVYRWTPLAIAAWYGRTEAAQVLIKAGAKVDAEDEEGRTALDKAADGGHVRTIAVLIKAGANVNATRKNAFGPLHYARNAITAKALLKAGANAKAMGDYYGTPLHRAASKGKAELVKALIEAGANVNAKIKSGLRRGETPLHQAAYSGHTEVVKALIEAGAEANAKDKDSQTPLHKAGYRGNAEVVKLLIKAGAQVNAKNSNGQTPLHEAASWANIEMVKALIKAGAEVNAKNSNGRTPLDLVPRWRKTGVDKVLIEAGAKHGDISPSTGRGRGPPGFY